MPLELKRPLAIFDLETTGVVPETDRIVEIAILRMSPDRTRTGYRKLVNPQIPIPPEATELHGISDTDVRDEKTFPEIANEVAEFMQDCDLAGFNVIAFDLRLLTAEFKRAGVEFSVDGRSIIDPQRIFHIREPRDLSAAARFYLGAEHGEAHSAAGDVEVTWNVLQAQLERYPDLPRDAAALHDICNTAGSRYVDPDRKFEWRYGKAAFAFGMHRGKLLEDIAKESPDYLRWMCDGQFPAEAKKIAREALEGTFPERKNVRPI